MTTLHLIGFLLFPLLMHGAIITTNDVLPYLNSATEQTLVIVDVADTLIEFKDLVLQKEYDNWKNHYFSQLMPDATFEHTARYIQIVEEVPSNWKLVNPNWPTWIEDLKNRNVNVVGLTKTLVYPPLQKSLMETLATFGIVFSCDLIATSSSLKDESVVELVQRFNPFSVLFIDDRLEQVESVDRALSRLNMPHEAIHFNTPHSAPALNIPLAEKQIETLVTEFRWLSDTY